MSFMFIIHVIVCVLLVAVILFQDGKAGGLTSVSDSGQSMFGAKGAASFLTKLTSGLAIAFMCTSLFLNFFGNESSKSIASDYQPKTEVSKPDDTSVKSEGVEPAAEEAATEATDAPAATEEAATEAKENEGEDQ